jgi:hypothetical protein
VRDLPAAMPEHDYLHWGWGPQYLLADRFHAPDPEYTPVPAERAAAVIEALARDDATALHQLGVATGWLEPEQAWQYDSRELADRVLDELERPSGRLALYERPGEDSHSEPDAMPEPEDVVDLLDLVVQDDTTTWIEFRLDDQDDEPFAGLEYELKHPDERRTTGRLNDLGIVHLDGIAPGSYTIRFPEAELVVLGEDGPNVGPLAPYGIKRLELAGAGGARSTGWTAHDEPPAADAESDFWLASGAETVKISYTLEDPEDRADEAVLELFVLDDDGDELVLWRRPLTDDERTAGDHELDWDGQVDVSGALPEGFVTVLRSPYTLRLRLRGLGEADPSEASTRFWVDVAAIELELGDRAVLDRELDRALYDTLGGSLPAPGQTKQVLLVSNLFKTRDLDMEDDTLFTAYEELWGSGPQIPVFATVKVKGSDGAAVVAPRALAGVPIAWEWLDVAKDTSTHHAAAKTFLDAALDFDKDLTEPAGNNCHVDYGGKRGPGAKPVFPEQTGYAPQASLDAGRFPFKVERYVERANVARSYAWTDGAVAGKTGVIFEPSRMAGDAWSLRVFPFRDLGEDGPAPGAMQASTGVFETWRELHVVEYLKKNASITDVAIPVFQAYYDAAHVKIVDKSGGSTLMEEAVYEKRLADAVKTQPPWVQAAVDKTFNQYRTNYGVHFREYAAFMPEVEAVMKQKLKGAFAAWWAGSGGTPFNTEPKYYERCKAWARDIMEELCKSYVNADPGVTVMHVSGLYNFETRVEKRLNGFAPDIDRTKSVFLLCAGPDNYSVRGRVEETLAHEIGHLMFLPHAPFTSGTDEIEGPQPNRHDATYVNCLMGYDISAERKLCGLCILRMRGWSSGRLSPNADENTRP